MNKMSSITRISAAIMIMSVMMSGTSVIACAEIYSETSLDDKSFDISEKLPDSEELFDQYVDHVFSIQNEDLERKKLPNTSGRAELNQTGKILYDFLSEKIAAVANGELSQSVFKITRSEFMEKADGYAQFDDYDLDMLMDMLLADLPYDLYWYDKTNGVSVSTGFTSMVFSFPVSADYSVSGALGTTDVNTVKTSAAINAAKNAQKILDGVEKNWSDYAVMTYFKDSICDLVSYNNDVAANPANVNYGDPWQMIYVFDENTATNVVCEGYAKAFKYLCDSYTFNSDIKCELMTGIMTTSTSAGMQSGGHMWNMVTISGTNYLVDVTNSDEKSIGSDGELFFAAIPSSQRLYDTTGNYSGVKVNVDSGSVTYVFDETTRTIFDENDLLIAEEPLVLHTVFWQNNKGDILEKDVNVANGEKPVYNGKLPTSSEGVFSGWDPAIPDNAIIFGEGEIYIFTAVFSNNGMRSVSFVIDDAEYSSIFVDEGGKIIEPEAPSKEGCTFEGWYADKEFKNEFDFDTPVNTDVSIYAKFTCHISWVDYDGTELYSEDVLLGQTPLYRAVIPEREATTQYTYLFNGWSPEIAPAQTETVYTATYSENVNKYTIVWKNYDGTILETDKKVPFGETPVYDGETPFMPTSDVSTHNAFKGWSPEVKPVEGDAEYTAVFSEETKSYTVTWLNADGSVLETDENVSYGEIASYDGDEPTMDSSGEFSYEFTGWTPTVSSVTEDTTYTAEYNKKTNHFNVTWKNWDGEILLAEVYKYGAMPQFNGDLPERAADSNGSYKFVGWSPAILPVSGNIEYVARFKSENNTDIEDNTDTEENTDSDKKESSDEPETPKRILGDVNNDLTVDSRDALFIFRSSLGLDELLQEDFKAADVDENTVIDSNDALLTLRYSVGIFAENRIGQTV